MWLDTVENFDTNQDGDYFLHVMRRMVLRRVQLI